MTAQDEEYNQYPVVVMSVLLVLCVCLGVTITAWRGVASFTERDNRGYFDALVSDSEKAILNRFRLYEQTLLGGQGLFRASDSVTRQDWANYVDSLSLEDNLPGIMALGYIQYVLPEDVNAELESMRMEHGNDIRIFPETEFPDKFIVKYQEPATPQNNEILGMDVGHEDCRRSSAIEAWQTGKPRLSCKIDLIQKEGVDISFALYVPVYYMVNAGGTAEYKSERLRGLVYGLFIAKDFLKDIDGISRNQLALNIFDGRKTSPDAVIFSSPNSRSFSQPYGHYSRKSVLSIAGREWSVIWHPTEKFVPRTSVNVAKATLVSGILFSFLIAALFYYQMSSAENIRRQVKSRTRELEEATRAKSDFLARMSHEIRTPLNGILGFVDMVRQTDLNDFQQQTLGKAEGAGRTLLTIINDILDLTKIDSDKMALEKSPFMVRTIFATCLDLVEHSARQKGLMLTLNIDESCPEILIGDQYRIQQILLNLLGNAVKFTESGFVRLHAQYAEGCLVASVTDSGIGIAGDKCDSIFESFMQEDASMTRRFGGTGLGLTICKQLAEAMDGRITVQSEKGSGSSFVLTLPLEIGDAEQAREAEARRHGKHYKILLVEDILMNQEITRAMLQRYGHDVDVASNGAEAVEAVKSSSYDLVLMDIQMPVMDGVTATRTIRDDDKKPSCNVPIVALTAHAMPGDITGFFEAGIDDYIIKPVKPHDLIDKIRQVIEDEASAGPPVQDNNIPSSMLADLAVFDKTDYTALVEMLGADKCLELYEHYKLDAGPRIEALLDDALPADQRHKHLHTMASMAGSMGFRRMEAECRQLMERLERLDASAARVALRDLATLYEQGCTLLEATYGPASAGSDKAASRASNI